MRVPSRHNFKRSKERRIVTVLVGALVVMLIGLALPVMFTALGRVVMYPVHAVNQWFMESSGRLPMYLKDQQKLIQRITDLENELAIASGTDLTQQRLYEENILLRQLLSVETSPRIGAGVVARPNELPYDMLQIDRGEVDGIKVGAPVYVGADNVIGIVSYVAPQYAFVELFTTPGFSATAFITGANVMTTLEGFGGGVARVSVPQGIPLSVGDLVHVPSIDPGVFGRISYIENQPSQPEQYGYITLQKPISSLNYVAVASETVTPVAPEAVEERVKELIKNSFIVDTSHFTLASTTATSTPTESATTTP